MTSVVPIVQNFSIPAGDAAAVNYTIKADETIDLVGSNITWALHPQNNAVPDLTTTLFSKVLDNGIQIDDPVLLKFHVSLVQADTNTLLGNYYYRAKVIIGGNTVTVVHGIMTVT